MTGMPASMASRPASVFFNGSVFKRAEAEAGGRLQICDRDLEGAIGSEHKTFGGFGTNPASVTALRAGGTLTN
jgi:hypothetical protein